MINAVIASTDDDAGSARLTTGMAMLREASLTCPRYFIIVISWPDRLASFPPENNEEMKSSSYSADIIIIFNAVGDKPTTLIRHLFLE